jgi:hypothetical protein
VINDGYDFLAQAAVFDNGSWVNIHRRLTFQDGRQPIMPGNAHQSVRTAAQDADFWSQQRGQCVYLAQGIFRNAGVMGPVYPKAIRQEPNLIACKNLYMDVDVKKDAYATHREALKAIKDFILQSKLPWPNLLVGSGNGGVHVYWTMDAEFEPKEFRRMAVQLVAATNQHGLIIDQQCTSDPVRLMRMVGTWNFKYATDTVDATPVTLLFREPKLTPLFTMQKALSYFKPTTTATSNTQGSKPGLNSDLSGGMKREFPPANIDVVATFCPFIKETLDKAGANLVGEPQWHMVVGLSCHCDDPTTTAHRLTTGHPDCTPEGTDAKLAQALQARKDRPNIGPDKCATIHNTHKIPQCATCPHLNRGTTPLSIQFKQPGSQTHQSNTNRDPNSIDLPPDYYRGNDNLIYKSIILDKGAGVEQALVCEYQILPGSAHVEQGKPNQFVFDTVQGGKRVTKRFDTTITADDSMFAKAFASEVLPITIPVKLSRTFMANFLKELQTKPDTLVDAPAFGWSLDTKGQKGFAFAGKFYSPAGEFRSTRPGDGVDDYRAVGDVLPWCRMASIILTPDRPDLCCMAAASFAAPLVEMTGHAGLLIGLVSSESGIGKSTALSFGQAVWSRPIVGGLSDTINYTFAKCTTLRHLPLFYDEIKGEKQMRAMVELAFQLTGGHEKGRSDRSGKMRKVNEFKTLCGYCANGSIVSAVRDEDRGTDASWLRMFEMQAIAAPNTAEEFAYEINEISVELNLNYGGIGAKYAEYLGQNYVKIAKGLSGLQMKIARELGADPKVERYWIDAIATVMLGAHLANKLGLCEFPLVAMQKFMYGEFTRMKDEMLNDPNDFGADIALTNALGAFLNEKQPRNLIILDKTWGKVGPPPKDYAKVLNGNRLDTAWGTLEVQISGDPLTIRISDSALVQWCKRTNRPKANLTTAMRKKLNARTGKLTIGSGSKMGGAAENVWIIEAAGTILEPMLEYTINHKFLPP